MKTHRGGGPGAAIAAAAAMTPAADEAAIEELRSPLIPKGAAAGMRVAVIGAGAFGGWTALYLLRAGAETTLIDPWGPGNARASSGGDSRMIRAIYGEDGVYVDLVARSFDLWRAHEALWRRTLYQRTGALWMFSGDDRYAAECLPHLERARLKAAAIDPVEAGRRYPGVDFSGVDSVYVEAEAGCLLARRACETVAAGFVAEGGVYLPLAAKPGRIADGALTSLDLSDGSRLIADRYVFACGPWLGKLFPETLGPLIRPSRQDVYYFGAPADDPRYAALPIWMDFGPPVYYGVPSAQDRGFKIGEDTRGSEFDPSDGDRTPDRERLERARAYIARRFPGMAGAPLIGARVCQYENSPDGHYILDRHPRADNLWLLGGGSGHGFKQGPALGEKTAAMITGVTDPEPLFQLARFQGSDYGTDTWRHGQHY